MQYVLDLQSSDEPATHPGARTVSSASLVACFSTWSLIVC